MLLPLSRQRNALQLVPAFAATKRRRYARTARLNFGILCLSHFPLLEQFLV
jgi:hypothetical protein